MSDARGRLLLLRQDGVKAMRRDGKDLFLEVHATDQGLEVALGPQGAAASFTRTVAWRSLPLPFALAWAVLRRKP